MNTYKINYTCNNHFYTYTEDAKNQIEALHHLFIDLHRLDDGKNIEKIKVLSVQKIARGF